MYDVAIIGAGPAGATLARLIADRYRVLLVDKRRLSPEAGGGGPEKCCGGLLAPDAQEMLARLGLGLPSEVLVGPQLFVVRTVDLPRRRERYYQRFYMNMDRQAFDRWLVSLVPPGVDRREGFTLKRCERVDRGFRITLSGDGETLAEEVGILIGADGAHSRVRAQCLPHHPRPREYFSVQEWVETESAPPYFSAIFDPGLTDFYCWTIPKGRALLIGAALTPRRRVFDRFALLKSRLAAHGFEFGQRIKREGSFLLRPRSARQVCLGHETVGLVGEAAGWISPSSAEGLSYAFKSAVCLAEALGEGPDRFLERYRRKSKGLRRIIALKTLKSSILYHPLLRRLIMGSSLGSMTVLRK